MQPYPQLPVVNLLSSLMGSKQLSTEIDEMGRGVSEAATLGLYSPEADTSAIGSVDIPLLGRTSPSRMLGNMLLGGGVGKGAQMLGKNFLRPVLGNTALGRYIPKQKFLYELEDLADRKAKLDFADRLQSAPEYSPNQHYYPRSAPRSDLDIREANRFIRKSANDIYNKLSTKHKAINPSDTVLGTKRQLQNYQTKTKEEIAKLRQEIAEKERKLENVVSTRQGSSRRLDEEAASYLQNVLDGKSASNLSSALSGFSPRTRQVIDAANRPIIDIATRGGKRALEEPRTLPDWKRFAMRRAALGTSVAAKQEYEMRQKLENGEISVDDYLSWKINSNASKDESPKTTNMADKFLKGAAQGALLDALFGSFVGGNYE